MHDIETYALAKGWETKHHTSPSGECLQVKRCPFCGGGDHGDQWSFALKLDDGASVCKRGNCGWKGSFLELQRALGDKPMRQTFTPRFLPAPKATAKKYTKPKDSVTDRHEALLANQSLMTYLTTTKSAKKRNRKDQEVTVQGRGFTLETIRRFKLGAFTGKVAGYETTWIAIPYFRDGELVRTKYRSVAKDFGIDVGSEPILYGIDDVQGNDVTIVEGEFDRIALAQCGVENVVSVPDGCGDLNWIDHNWDWLAAKTTIRIAVDFDEGGAGLEREIVNRLGRDRCVRVKLPHKDANACLQAGMNPAEIKRLVDAAEPYPMEGLFTATDLYDDVFALYNHDLPRGHSTGWPTLDGLWGGIRMGEVTVVTGAPGSGKSEWVSNLVINLARLGIKSVVGSFENPAPKVIRNMTMQLSGLPFAGHRRMTVDQLQEAVAWLHDRIYFLNLPDDEQNWENVAEHFRYAVRRYGCKVVVADPLTMLLGDSSKDSERFDIDNIMRAARRLVTGLDIHLILIAHPKKLASDDAVADLYDINGSAGVRNLTWNGISVWRNRKGEGQGVNEVAIHLKKNREIGTEGAISLLFEPFNKTYRENPNPATSEAQPSRPRYSTKPPDPPRPIAVEPARVTTIPFLETEVQDLSDYE